MIKRPMPYIYYSATSRIYRKDLDDERSVDYDAEGNPRGIEFLCVSTGVITDDLPEREKVENMLGEKAGKSSSFFVFRT
jgi:hypothetical protein